MTPRYDDDYLRALIGAALEDEGLDMRPGRGPREYSLDDVLAELLAMLQEVKAATEQAVELGRAASIAELSARVRDQEAAERHPVDLAAGLLRWILLRANADEDRAGVDRAIRAASQEPDEPLGAELRALVVGYLDGALSDEALDKRLSKPSAGLSTARKSPSAESPAHAVPLPRLAEEMALAIPWGTTPATAWATFMKLARREVRVEPPLFLREDVCLFEWGVEADEFVITMARRFRLEDEHGDPERTEQVSCRFWTALTAQYSSLTLDACWGDTGLEAWVKEVENLPAYRAFIGGEDWSGPEIEQGPA